MAGWTKRPDGTMAQSPEVILKRGDTGWSIGKVHRCGSVWSCPVCAHQISRQRITEVVDAVNWWRARARGNDIAMLTLTVRHHAGESLKALRQAVSHAWRTFQQGRLWQEVREACGAVHFVRCHDVTWGENGWHPHLHVMLLCDTPDAAEGYQDAITAAWRKTVVRLMGKWHLPSVSKAVKFAACHDASYVARLGLETASPASKTAREGHLAPMQMVDELIIAKGAEQERLGAAWREYSLGMSGCHQLQWSRGLRAAFGCTLPDVMLVGVEVECEPDSGAEPKAVLASIPRETWREMALKYGLTELDRLGRMMVGQSDETCRDALLSYFSSMEGTACMWHWRADTPRLRWVTNEV